MLPPVLLIVLVVIARSASCVPVDVVLIPGNEGSRLESRWVAPSYSPAMLRACADARVETTWSPLWFTVMSAFGATDCLISRMTLEFDAATNTSHNAAGLRVRTVGQFGDTGSVEVLDPTLPDQTEYFRPMARALRAAGATVYAAPYDFRYAADTLQTLGWHQSLTDLIEKSFATSGRRVALVSHSLGSLMALHFLNGKTREWTASRVAFWAAIASPWGGTAEEVRALAIGSGALVPLPPAVLRPFQASREITYWLLPTEQAFGDADVIATLPPETPDGLARNYTAATLPALLAALPGLDGRARPLLDRTRRLTAVLPDPHVAVHNLVGTGLATPARLSWPTSLSDPPEVGEEDGDGIVTSRSANTCIGRNWAMLSPTVSFPGVGHRALVRDASVIDAVVRLVAGRGASGQSNDVVVVPARPPAAV